MATRGGKRPGAGRKPGIPNKASQKRQEKIAATGITPLELMIEHMRELWGTADQLAKKAQKLAKTADDNAKEVGKLESKAGSLRAQAATVAKEAAPYVHPKLSSITGAGGGAVVIREITRTIVEPKPKANGDARHSNGEDFPASS